MNAEASYIRDAISSEEYQRALAQWNDYAARLRRAIEAGTLSDDQMEEARALFEWSRGVLLGARAHLRDRYRQLEAAAAYNTRPATGPGRFVTRL